MALGRLLGLLLRWRVNRGDALARHELLYVGALMLAFGLARATATSTFVVMFAVGAMLLTPFQDHAQAGGGQTLSQRMGAFGERIERLLEAATVLLVGLALHSVPPTGAAVAFGLVLVPLVRPLSVMAVLRHGVVTRHQRRLMAWFGIRGIGSLFYMAFALEQGVAGSLAVELMSAVLTAIALSIILHGMSATPLMTAYQQRRRALPGLPSGPPTTPKPQEPKEPPPPA